MFIFRLAHNYSFFKSSSSVFYRGIVSYDAVIVLFVKLQCMTYKERVNKLKYKSAHLNVFSLY